MDLMMMITHRKTCTRIHSTGELFISLARYRRTYIATMLAPVGLIMNRVASSAVNLRIQLDWHC